MIWCCSETVCPHVAWKRRSRSSWDCFFVLHLIVLSSCLPFSRLSIRVWLNSNQNLYNFNLFFSVFWQEYILICCYIFIDYWKLLFENCKSILTAGQSALWFTTHRNTSGISKDVTCSTKQCYSLMWTVCACLGAAAKMNSQELVPHGCKPPRTELKCPTVATWCNYNHLKLNINRTNEVEVHNRAWNMDVD